MVASHRELTMTDSRFLDLGQVVLDDAFPDVDLALRRGRHVDRDDELWYAFLSDAQEHLEPFYARFGCDLVHRADGYFYLLPTTEKLGRRHLGLSEMLVGQALTLLYLDPRTVQDGGVVTRGDVLGLLSAVMGPDALVHALSAKKKRIDERVAQENVRARVAEAIRRLAGFGFVTLLEEERLRLRSALLRFAEPVRGEQSPREALEELLAKGEVVLHDEGSTFASDDDADSHGAFDDEGNEQDDEERGDLGDGAEDDDLGDGAEDDDLGDGAEDDDLGDGAEDDGEGRDVTDHDDLGDGAEHDVTDEGAEREAPDDDEEAALSEGEAELEATPFYEDELLDDELDGLQPRTNSDFDDDPDGFEESS